MLTYIVVFVLLYSYISGIKTEMIDQYMPQSLLPTSDTDLQSLTEGKAVNKTTDLTTQDFLPNNKNHTEDYVSQYDYNSDSDYNESDYKIASPENYDYDESEHYDYNERENYDYDNNLLMDRIVTMRTLEAVTAVDYPQPDSREIMVPDAGPAIQQVPDTQAVQSAWVIETAYLTNKDLQAVIEKETVNKPTNFTTQEFLLSNDAHTLLTDEIHTINDDYAKDNNIKVSPANYDFNENDINFNKIDEARINDEHEKGSAPSLLVEYADKLRRKNVSENHEKNAANMFSTLPLHFYVMLICHIKLF